MSSSDFWEIFWDAAQNLTGLSLGAMAAHGTINIAVFCILFPFIMGKKNVGKYEFVRAIAYETIQRNRNVRDYLLNMWLMGPIFWLFYFGLAFPIYLGEILLLKAMALAFLIGTWGNALYWVTCSFVVDLCEEKKEEGL